MSMYQKGSMPNAITVSLEPDRSGNFVCDGTADEVQINAALDYAYALGGGTVHVKAGNYAIDDDLLVREYCCLQGEGYGTAFLGYANVGAYRGFVKNYEARTYIAPPGGIDYYIIMEKFRTVSNSEQENNFYTQIEIRGMCYSILSEIITDDSNASQGWGILVSGEESYTTYMDYIINTHMHGGGIDGCQIKVCSNIYMCDCCAWNNDVGMDSWRADDIYFVACQSYNNNNDEVLTNNHGFVIHSGTGCAVIACVAWDNYMGFLGWTSDYPPEGYMFIGNTMRDNYNRVGAGGSDIDTTGDRCIHVGNFFLQPDDNGKRGCDCSGDYNLWIGNYFRGGQQERKGFMDCDGIYNMFLGNTFYSISPGNTEACLYFNDTGNMAWHNMFLGSDRGLYIETDITGTWLHMNYFDPALNDRILDNGVDTKYDSITVPFVEGTAFVSADGSAKGWEIDSADEWAATFGTLPLWVQESRKLKVQGVGLIAPGAAGRGMYLNIVMQSGLGDEAYTSEVVSGSPASDETNFAAGDIIQWTITPAVDTDMDELVGGEHFEIKVKYAAGDELHCNTDAVIRAAVMEFI